MALIDRPRVRGLLEQAENRLGVAVRPTSQVRRHQLLETEFADFIEQSSELAFFAMDYVGGRPQEMRREMRVRLAQRSRIALLEDPLAAAEAQLLADFAFGKGISVPTARDPKVQDVIDEGWTDANNERKLTSFLAQRKLSNDLITSGELFVTLHFGVGRVRVGRLLPDDVVNTVVDPDDADRVLYYVVRQRRQKWNFDTDAPDFTELTDNGRPKVMYWPDWRNLEDAEAEREIAQLAGEPDEEPLPQPPAEKLASGKVYHLPINQTLGQTRGNPPWARSLRFFSAMNVLTEAHVTMAQAASSFIARRSMRGSPRQINKAAANVLTSAGELGAATLRPAGFGGVFGNAEATTQPFAMPGSPPPFPPGSWWTENDASKLEALNLNSGAQQMATTATIVRAPIAAASGFGQHYLGDASNANLATASTLELPATMHVGSWQEYFEGMYRWFTDRVIEAAVKAGRLGGAEGFIGRKPLGEMRLAEAEDRAEMETRTGKDLSYEFTMPFPGRRQLADVTTLVQQTCASMDPNGVNIPLRRLLLRFLFEQMGIDDVSRAVEECIPEKGLLGGIGPGGTTGAGAQGAPGAPGAPPAGMGAGAGAKDPTEGQQPYGARSGTAAGGGSAGEDGALEAEVAAIPEGLRSSVDELVKGTGDLFAQLVANPAVSAAFAMSSNGSAGD